MTRSPIAQSELLTIGDVHTTILAAADREDAGGKCIAVPARRIWIRAHASFSFSGSTQTIDLTSAAPACNYLVEQMIVSVANVQSSEGGGSRLIWVELGYDTAGTFRRGVRAILADADFTGGGAPYSYAGQPTFGMSTADVASSVVLGDGNGPTTNVNSLGVRGGLITANQGSEFGKLQLLMTATGVALKVGDVEAWVLATLLPNLDP